VPLERPTHVILVGLDGLRPDALTPERTPSLCLMQREGAFTWDLQTPTPQDRIGTYRRALTALPARPHRARTTHEERRRSLFTRCRAAGLTALALVRSPKLLALDPHAVHLPAISAGLDDAETAGAYAAAEFLRTRPACLFVELSTGRDPLDRCDAGLGRILAAVRHAGLAERTTVIVLSATPEPAWFVRGPGTRQGHRVTSIVSAADTLATAAALLHVPADDALGRPVLGAFRARSREPMSDGERAVPRGSVRGRLYRPNGEPMRRASILLVADHPADGIHERWADTDGQGEFRFDRIPADTYDYAFAFDNLPARLRRGLLVARDLKVRRDTTVEPVLSYQPIPDAEGYEDGTPVAERAAAFLSDDALRALQGRCRAGGEVPLLASDALLGRRVRTTALRRWLLDSADGLREEVLDGPMAPAGVRRAANLAAVYGLNRASGLLTRAEDREVRAALEGAVGRLAGVPRSLIPAGDAETCLALALIAAALRPSESSEHCLRRANAMFESYLARAAARAELEPTAIDHAELCSMLEYAMVRNALGDDAFLDARLRRVTELAAACLTPEQRAFPAGRTAPPSGLGFLGLANSAFADEPFGREMRSLWELCGRPTWAPHGEESVVGPLLTTAAAASPLSPTRARSRQLSRSAVLLTRDWGTPDEWMAVVNGWAVELHVRGRHLASVRTAPLGGRVEAEPTVLRFVHTPTFDYALLGGTVSHGPQTRGPAYRHVFFNKLTGYLVLSDELPAGFLTLTEVQRRGEEPLSPVRIDAPDSAQGVSGNVLSVISYTSRPTLVVQAPPADRGPAELRPWPVDEIPLADSEAAGTGTHWVVSTERGREFFRLARAPAHVAGHFEDNLLEASVGLVRCGPNSTDLALLDGHFAQSGDLLFRLSRGVGHVTIHRDGRVEGWSAGPSRRVAITLGGDAPSDVAVTVDGRARKAKVEGDRVTFSLPRGACVFRIE